MTSLSARRQAAHYRLEGNRRIAPLRRSLIGREPGRLSVRRSTGPHRSLYQKSIFTIAESGIEALHKARLAFAAVLDSGDLSVFLRDTCAYRD
jgi:hypothetical protein